MSLARVSIAGAPRRLQTRSRFERLIVQEKMRCVNREFVAMQLKSVKFSADQLVSRAVKTALNTNN